MASWSISEGLLGDRLSSYDGEYMQAALNWVAVVGRHLPIRVTKSSLAGIVDPGSLSTRVVELYLNLGTDASFRLPIDLLTKAHPSEVAEYKDEWVSAFSKVGPLKQPNLAISVLVLLDQGACKRFDEFLKRYIGQTRAMFGGANALA